LNSNRPDSPSAPSMDCAVTLTSSYRNRSTGARPGLSVTSLPARESALNASSVVKKDLNGSLYQTPVSWILMSMFLQCEKVVPQEANANIRIVGMVGVLTTGYPVAPHRDHHAVVVEKVKQLATDVELQRRLTRHARVL
jgi:hypothetical protein